MYIKSIYIVEYIYKKYIIASNYLFLNKLDDFLIALYT
jgi:hypothetical protein